MASTRDGALAEASRRIEIGAMILRHAFAGFLSVVAAAATTAIIVSACVAYADGFPRILAPFMFVFAIAFGHALIPGLPVATVLAANGTFRAGPLAIAGRRRRLASDRPAAFRDDPVR